ncbi:hypothetical protein BJY01DRAFT_138865 [Aspergillus pseudoustus]|uniref:NADH:flavin oxidoreductase/NADH oxidase N-terminal domain-containing protein n=1 Tax=Aspergillus pseudoustus TaxID=1810923 RepID=A0ABR4KCB7_9EURO
MPSPPGLKGLHAPAPNIPYFTPRHLQSPGTPTTRRDASAPAPEIPTLFTPLRIRNATLRNRIVVAPMCQFSTAPEGPAIGALTDYHIATLGHYALKGAALVFVEATGVQRNGRISAYCPGLWSDGQIEGLRRVSDFVKSQGALAGVQLAHAGRKASVAPPWARGSAAAKRTGLRADAEQFGWPEDVVGPSGGEEQTWDGPGRKAEESGHWPPRELTRAEIRELVDDWGRAAKRAVQAGVDVIEIHAAHGYLIHQFLSPVSNHRTDEYGGSFENRTRLLLEIARAMRREMPEGMPLFVRVSATEWLEGSDVEKKVGGSWTVEETIRLAKLLPDVGVDLLDVSSGGNHPKSALQGVRVLPTDYQTKNAARIRKELREAGCNLLVGAVGLITEAEQARDLLEADKLLTQEAFDAKNATEAKDGNEPAADIVLVARQFMREPEWVLRVAWKLGVDVAWPNQFLRVRFPKI